MKKGVVILQIDGLSYDMLRRSLKKGYLPHLSSIIKSQDYEQLSYRCGLPSATPFCQAGILYGEGKNIPAFRWWDKKEQLLVTFGSQTTFQHVSSKYFKKHEPLLKGGACFAACFAGGAKESFTLVHSEGLRRLGHVPQKLLLKLLKYPWNLIIWVFESLTFIFLSIKELVRADISYTPVAIKYILYDIFSEIVINHVTRFAVRTAMEEGLPIIFAGFYAYDNAAHAFGPEHSFSYRVLRQIDNSIYYLQKHLPKNSRSYEFVFLSDHGSVKTVPFLALAKEHLAHKIARVLPGFAVEEVSAKTIAPAAKKIGDMLIVHSGQMTHLYINNSKSRFSFEFLQNKYPTLLSILKNLPEISCLLMKGNKGDILLTAQEKIVLGSKTLGYKAKKFLSQFDDPVILAKQLHSLNASSTAGDIIIFGAFFNGKQVTFEQQEGSHSAFGGEQALPFVLVKKKWRIKTSRVILSEQLYPKLMRLKKQLEIKGGEKGPL